MIILRLAGGLSLWIMYYLFLSLFFSSSGIIGEQQLIKQQQILRANIMQLKQSQVVLNLRLYEVKHNPTDWQSRAANLGYYRPGATIVELTKQNKKNTNMLFPLHIVDLSVGYTKLSLWISSFLLTLLTLGSYYLLFLFKRLMKDSPTQKNRSKN